MKLTQEDIEKFKYYADNKIRLKLTGQNYIGQPFETEGFIVYDHNNPDAKRLEAYSLAIFQGRYLDSSFCPGAKKDYALFFTEPVQNVKECLYIESIYTAKDSKLVFTNPDFSDIISKSIEENQEAYEEGQNLNDASRELLPLVGKPVVQVDNRGYHSKRTIIAIRCTDNCQGKQVIVTDCFNPGSNILTGPRRKMVVEYHTRPEENILEDFVAGASMNAYERNAKHEQEMERK